MRRLVCCVVLLAACTVCGQLESAEPSRPHAQIEVFFSPKGGCTEAIVKEVRAAKRSVLVQAYWFTSATIAKELVAAHKRGVKVQVILDRSRTEIENEQAEFIVQSGVPTFIDDKHTTAHSKVVVIDGQVVITGSFNFTDQAEEENLENLLVIRDQALAAKFTANWKAHLQHSLRYAKRESGAQSLRAYSQKLALATSSGMPLAVSQRPLAVSQRPLAVSQLPLAVDSH